MCEITSSSIIKRFFTMLFLCTALFLSGGEHADRPRYYPLIETEPFDVGSIPESVRNPNLYYYDPVEFSGEITIQNGSVQRTLKVMNVWCSWHWDYNIDQKLCIFVTFNDTDFRLVLFLDYHNESYTLTNIKNETGYQYAVTYNRGNPSWFAVPKTDYIFDYSTRPRGELSSFGELSSLGELTWIVFEDTTPVDLSDWNGRDETIASVRLSLTMQCTGYLARNHISEEDIDFVKYMNTSAIVKSVPGELDRRVQKDPWTYLPELVEYLVRGQNDVLIRAKIIFDWITENIYYHWDEETSFDNTCWGTLEQRATLCGGYARLFEEMCRTACIDARSLSGKNDEGGLHGWNVIMVNGRYYFFDTTGGTTNGYYGNGDFRQGLTNNKGFGFSPENFIPVRRNRKWDELQFILPPLSDKEIMQLSYTDISAVNSFFYEAGMEVLDGIPNQIHIESRPYQFRFRMPRDTECSIRLNDGTENIHGFLKENYSFEGDTVLYTIEVFPLEAGEYTLNLFVKNDDIPEYQFCGAFTIITSGRATLDSSLLNIEAQSPYPRLSRVFSEYGLRLASDVYGMVKLTGGEYLITVSAPKDVVLHRNIKKGGTKYWDNHLFQKKVLETRNEYTLFFKPYEPGIYSLQIFVLDPGMLTALDCTVDVIKANTVSYPRNRDYYNFSGSTLISPLEGTLKTGQNYLFQIILPDCDSGFLYSDEGKVELNKRGKGLFSLDYQIPYGVDELYLYGVEEGGNKQVLIYKVHDW
jgi:transglutaminase-like putative cysteine protease